MKIFFTTLSLFLACSTISAQQTVGFFSQTAQSLDGYVLFAPIRSDTTYLIDKCGKKVHQWSSTKKPGLAVYLLPNGNLLRSEAIPNTTFNGNGSAGGKIETYDWNSNPLWSYTVSTSLETQNHDVCPLPNGNIIVAIWEKLTPTEAIAAGRNPSLLDTALWSARLMEIQPVGTNSVNIVWQWRLWDHLVQDFDNTKTNFGVVTDHPELLNLNFNGTNPANAVDWIHMNAVTYNAALDQVMFSSHNLSEIYIIDHSTTTAQATSHSGGVHNKGGDFLYRWGNPASYNRGTATDRKLYLQHNPNWIPAGYPDANKIMIFNNGVNRPGGNSSSVEIISPPVDGLGDYAITTGVAYGPVAQDWTYFASTPSSFYAQSMGSAQPLSNGNTIICEATTGDFFEVDSLMNTVWDYVNPVGITGPISQGTTSTSNQSFRCIFYPASYTGFNGQTLTAGNPIELNPLSYTCTTTNGISQNKINLSAYSVVNPFNQTIIFTPQADLKNASVTLTGIQGNILKIWDDLNFEEGKSVTLAVSEILNTGMYILHVKTKNTSHSFKLIHE